ncbi:2-desacetyl-2-hydroxyethyl bacteriochlorophyllide A dehydrogenase [Saccharothrix ecbatanensis]|uniref:2-desacetyl-2-hydroxyethyl bacteriochlorophyllide A dehydrogenase n=1 Tax=Saccharothrix ecbatanensis TaxID=1105145 RepID=A0A7W9HKT5_9PSEU|nr:zinc-binding alcohol dehydrogenase [Saccharothrix ecbatanensis]MBB5803783.1 2-desacetyl-2-hydroxyethyl bacteriochlorophyllide A dehydrogenase [Saccharothrix ecbatanensis]
MATVVRMDGPGSVSLAEEPDLPITPTGVRIRTLYSGISAGTELTQYRGTNAHFVKTWDPDVRLFVPGRPTAEYPTVVGYEEVGEVVQVGPEVTTLRPGQVVWGVWGHRSGTVVDESYATWRVLDPRADPILGIFSHIGSVALNVVLDSDIHVGETVVVFGLGVVGQIVAQLARRNGARVIGVDTIPHRIELARELGADEVLDAGVGEVAERVRKLTDGRGADVALDVSGNHLALHEAVRSVAYNSRVVAGGFYQGEARGLFLGEEFHHNRVTLVCSQISGVAAAHAHRWDRKRLATTVIDLAVTGRLDLRPLVSHVMPIEEAASAYKLIDTQPDQVTQVVFDFTGTTAGDRGPVRVPQPWT